ncbi:MAG: winged helix-turn-helix domain-containing protein [Natronospirillum sp.]|uniref:winged helix-turn-helix domain-containing protein n=1 Tax=Natronospirillum sp. TaxID=2812955 RepID=UPI0025D3947F|nr:winged helix-turn-helix domain-containing protein [Natronospirillum sp.]MCH8551203.1 winged helix-turn-helix domain-containing protein [Natronospirillum sp.]
MTANRKVLMLVDDDAANRRRLGDYFVSRGYHLLEEDNGKVALKRIAEEHPDVVIAAVDLPGENGLTLCKLSRQAFFGPFVLMAERCDELDQVLGLDMGADDYVLKEVSPRLLAARMSAVFRRVEAYDEPTKCHHERLDFGDLVVDNTMREAWLNDQPIELTSAEFDLLWLLGSHAGRILTREEIFTRLRGIEYDGQDRSVDVRVSRIRPKVGDDPDHPRRIKTVRSKGYLFVEDPFSPP